LCKYLLKLGKEILINKLQETIIINKLIKKFNKIDIIEVGSH